MDPNLRLTLLQSLWYANLAPRFDKEAFFREVLGEPWDVTASYNDGVDERVRDALLAIPISDEQLARLPLLQWDGGNDIHALIWENWRGEDETFDVRDLGGVERCVALREIAFTSGLQASDLSPLAGLASLTEVMLLGRPLSDLEPLLELPSLERLRLYYLDRPRAREVLAILGARGVDISGCSVR